jgi:ATP-dependent Clp protease protease subunit
MPDEKKELCTDCKGKFEIASDDVDPVAMQQAPATLRSSGVYLFTYPVNAATVRPVMEWILQENLYAPAERQEYLQLFINSPGGSVMDCFALTDVMEASAVPVRTTGIGMIASCGLLIFMAGQKGHRIITPNTSILSHQFSAGMMGKEHELMSANKRFEQVGSLIMRHYQKHTKLSVTKIRKELMPPEDRWVTPKEALKLNLADKIKKLGS